jgi:hypothetical protein
MIYGKEQKDVIGREHIEHKIPARCNTLREEVRFPTRSGQPHIFHSAFGPGSGGSILGSLTSSFQVMISILLCDTCWWTIL